MATLIASKLSERNGTVIQTAILTLELLLLSTGFVSTFFMLKKAISPFAMVVGNIRELLVHSFHNFFKSPVYICVLITSVFILLSIFSNFHHPSMDFLNIFQDETKDSEDLLGAVDHDETPVLPAAIERVHEREDVIIPKRTNSAIAIDTVMSFFSRYNCNSHPVLDDIQDEMPSFKDIEVDCIQKTSFADISHYLTQPHEINNNNPHSPTTHVQETQENHVDQEYMTTEEEQEGEVLEDDSLEATWKAITGGGSNNKEKKQGVIKKSETWPVTPEMQQQPGGGVGVVVASAQSIGSKDLLPSVAAAWRDLRKSLTFNDSFSVFRRGGLRGDFSVTTAEESNKKFDDFIKKINYERMLQRQESDQRALKNMLNGAR